MGTSIRTFNERLWTSALKPQGVLFSTKARNIKKQIDAGDCWGNYIYIYIWKARWRHAVIISHQSCIVFSIGVAFCAIQMETSALSCAAHWPQSWILQLQIPTNRAAAVASHLQHATSFWPKTLKTTLEAMRKNQVCGWQLVALVGHGSQITHREDLCQRCRLKVEQIINPCIFVLLSGALKLGETQIAKTWGIFWEVTQRYQRQLTSERQVLWL